MAHLPQSLGFDLTNTLTRDLELFAHFFERTTVPIDQAETKRQDATLALGEGVEDIDDLFAEKRESRHVVRIFRRFVFDEIAEAGVVAIANR